MCVCRTVKVVVLVVDFRMRVVEKPVKYRRQKGKGKIVVIQEPYDHPPQTAVSQSAHSKPDEGDEGDKEHDDADDDAASKKVPQQQARQP